MRYCWPYAWLREGYEGWLSYAMRWSVVTLLKMAMMMMLPMLLALEMAVIER